MAREYNERVLEHFREPRNVGVIDDADGVGQLGDASCGDVFVMYIKVEDEHLVDIKYRVQGCGAAIAVCSMVSELALGKTIEEALHLTDAEIAEALGGLPEEKLHCSNLGATVLHLAIDDYCDRQWLTLEDGLGEEVTP